MPSTSISIARARWCRAISPSRRRADERRGRGAHPPRRAGARTLAHHLNGLGIEAIAVCFLHAYANPAHEIVAGQTLRRLCPNAFVTTSHEILRAFREYERTSTTALNAYRGAAREQLSRLASKRSPAGEILPASIAIMRSNGGTMSIAEARRQPVAMMESGPVAGMIGAAHLARLLGIEQVIGFDMGGTTAKTALIAGGVLPIEEGYVIGDAFTGQPMQLPVVDIVEVGAGGGSIAWVRRHRRAPCRPGLGRRRSGAGLLRPRRRAADGHRCRPAARPPQRRALPRRRHDARS